MDARLKESIKIGRSILKARIDKDRAEIKRRELESKELDKRDLERAKKWIKDGQLFTLIEAAESKGEREIIFRKYNAVNFSYHNLFSYENLLKVLMDEKIHGIMITEKFEKFYEDPEDYNNMQYIEVPYLVVTWSDDET